MNTDDLAHALETVILRRLREKRIAGYTLEMSQELAGLAVNSHEALVSFLRLLKDEDSLPPHNPQYQPFDALDVCPPGHKYECGACEMRRRLDVLIALASKEK